MKRPLKRPLKIPLKRPLERQLERPLTRKDSTPHVLLNTFIAGLCWGENAQVHAKENFPYSEAALRSTQLWHNLTEARVAITIVHKGDHPSQVELDIYNLDQNHFLF